MGERMRELIYVSQRKLNQFQRDAPTRRRRRRIKDVGATAPMNLGGLQVTFTDQGTAEQPTLADVIAHIDSGKHAIRWWNDPDAQPGEWVRFDTDLRFVASSKPDEWLNFDWLERSDRVRMPPPMVVFWDAAPSPGVIRRRLMLHGSPDHLIGGRPITMSDVTAIRPCGSLPAEMAAFASQLASGGSPNKGLSSIISQLDHGYLPEMAARMSGYARISFNADARGFSAETQDFESYRIVEASPLVVEYER